MQIKAAKLQLREKRNYSLAHEHYVNPFWLVL